MPLQKEPQLSRATRGGRTKAARVAGASLQMAYTCSGSPNDARTLNSIDGARSGRGSLFGLLGLYLFSSLKNLLGCVLILEALI